jgi:hypothetical protein
MSRSIPLHPKFGVNPSMGVCFWCGKEDGTILLLGANSRDGGREAPRRMVASMEPCPSCRADMDKGVTIIEAREPAHYTKEPRPTGRWVVVTDGFVRMNFTPDAVVSTMLEKRKAFMEPVAFKYMFGHMVDGDDSNKD